jgi:hypothetical protein
MIILGGIIMKLAFSTLGCPDWSFDEITASGIYAAARAVAEITGVSAPEVEIDDEEFYDDSEGE